MPGVAAEVVDAEGEAVVDLVTAVADRAEEVAVEALPRRHGQAAELVPEVEQVQARGLAEFVLALAEQVQVVWVALVVPEPGREVLVALVARELAQAVSEEPAALVVLARELVALACQELAQAELESVVVPEFVPEQPL